MAERAKGVRHFRITGEALTTIARDIMLSERPGHAWRAIAHGLHGDGNIERIATEVLDGKKKLVGDETAGIGVEPDQGKAVARYQKDLAYIYAGRVRVGGSWWRPIAEVEDFGWDDALFAMKRGAEPVSSLGEAWSQNQRFFRDRVLFYAGEGERVFECERSRGKKAYKQFIIFEPVGEPPFWWRECTDPSAALRDALARGRRLRKESWSQSFRDINRPKRQITHEETEEERQVRILLEDEKALLEEATWKKRLEDIQRRVLAQANDEMITLEHGGSEWRVPRAPFINWALRRTSLKHLAPPWDCVSPSGLKLPNDNPYHSDWMIGAGLDLDNAYEGELHDAAWAKMSELHHEYGDFECTVVVDAGEVRGVVGKDIVVLPNLSPRYVEAVEGKRAVVTEAGGAMAHLAVISLERGVTVVLVPGALQRYKEGEELTITPAEGKISTTVRHL